MTNKMLDNLRSIVQDVNAAHDLKSALNIIVNRVKLITKADVVSIYFLDNKTNKLILMASEGLLHEAVSKIKFKPDQGLVGYIAQNVEIVNLDNAQIHPNFEFAPETDEKLLHGYLGVPIIQHRQTLGVLIAQQFNKRRFSATHETFLVTLASQLAGAISHAEKMGELNEWLEDENNDNLFSATGLPGSPGVAIGQAMVISPPVDLDNIPDKIINESEIEKEQIKFTEAVNRVEKEFSILSQQMKNTLSDGELALFDAYSLMLKSDSLTGAILTRIKSGEWAQGALRAVFSEHINLFNTMENSYFRDRAADIKDLGQRILSYLQLQQPRIKETRGPVILVGDEINISHFTEISLNNLAGIISTRGSASSHVAILSKALGIPSVIGIDDLSIGLIEGKQLVIDGYSGSIFIEPTKNILKEYERLLSEEQILDDKLNKLIDEPSLTLDGHHIPLMVNTGLLADIQPSLDCGADGVGLYRTEIPFLIRDGFPSEEEQTQVYKEVLKSFSPKPVTFRTLDIGGDKALPYFPVVEENPFLGWRGIRIMLDHPEIFLAQLRAIFRANLYENNLRLMLPMISEVSEVDKAFDLIKQAHAELITQGIPTPFPSIGLMIEVPSAIYQMEALARRADFFSIGSNDLTQYLLAVDRNNKRVSGLYDCLHPAVLASIQQIIHTAHLFNKPVSVCGEMAGDPAAALALLGMRIDSLSMSAGSLLKTKWVIRSFSQKVAEQLVTTAQKMENTADIRLFFENALINSGLGGLIRAGK